MFDDYDLSLTPLKGTSRAGVVCLPSSLGHGRSRTRTPPVSQEIVGDLPYGLVYSYESAMSSLS